MSALASGASWRTGKADVASVAAAPDPFSPATADGRADEARIDSAGAALTPNRKRNVEYAVAVYHVVADEGAALWRQATLVPISFPAGSHPGTATAVANATTWDGRDDDGALVADGRYDIRVVYALLGRKTSGATAPWPVGDALVEGFVDTVLGTSPDGADGGVWSGYGADGVKLFGFDDETGGVTVDNGPPQIEIDSPADGAVLMASPVAVRGRVLDAADLAHLWVNGLEVPTTAGRFEASVELAHGPNVIDVLAEDLAGNRSSLSITVTYAPDTTGPEIVIEYPLPADEVLETPVDVIGTVYDPAGVTAVFVGGLPAELIAGEFFARADLLPGPNTIVVTAYDGWGNRSVELVDVVFRESGPPELPSDPVVRGRVYDDTTGAPLGGVRVTVDEPARWATTVSDGTFSLAVPPADSPIPGPLEADAVRLLVVRFQAEGYLPAARIARVPEHPAEGFIASVEPVYLVARDPVATVIGAEGGIAWNSTGTVAVEVPPGALAGPVEMRLTWTGTSRGLPALSPEHLAFVAGSGLEPSGVHFLLPVRIWMANDAGLSPGTTVPSAWHDAGDWAPSGHGVVSDDGDWLVFDSERFSYHYPAFPAYGAEPPIEGPQTDECSGSGCDSMCDNGVGGGSVVSQRTGRLSETIVVGPDGHEHADGLSPWPLRLVYSSDTVVPSALLEQKMWFPPLAIHDLRRVSTPVRATVNRGAGGGEFLREWLFRGDGDPDLALPTEPPARFRYRYDALTDAGGALPTGIYEAHLIVGSYYEDLTYGGSDSFGSGSGGSTGTTTLEGFHAWSDRERSVVVRNEVASPFGAGWALAGLKQLVAAPTGSAATGDRRWVVFDAGGATESFHGVRPGELLLVAGHGGQVPSPEGRPAVQSGLRAPSALAFDGDGRLFIGHWADAGLWAIGFVDDRGLLYRAVSGLDGVVHALTWSGPHDALFAVVGNRVLRIDCRDDLTVPSRLTCTSAWFAGGGPDEVVDDGDSAIGVTFPVRSSGGTWFRQAIGGVWASPTARDVYLTVPATEIVWKIDSEGRLRRVAGTGMRNPPANPLDGDGGPALDADLNGPGAITGDASGNIFFADHERPDIIHEGHEVFGNVAIRRIDAATRVLSTVVGTNMFGWTGDGYPAAGNPSFPVISLAVSPPRPGAPNGELHFGVQGYVTAGGSSAPLQFDLVRKVDGAGLLDTVVGREESHETINASCVAQPAIRVLLREASSLAFLADELHYAERPANVVYRVVGADDTIVAEPGTMAELTQVEVWPGTSYMLLVHPGLRRDWFDESGRLFKTTSPDQASFGWEYTYLYGPDGRLLRIRDDASRTATFEYDASGRLTGVLDFSGERTQFTVDSAGDLVAVERAGFPGTRRTFTYENHLLRTQQDGRRQSEYVYGPGGTVNEVDLRLDGVNRVWREISPSSTNLVLNDIDWLPGGAALPLAVTAVSPQPLGGFPATAFVTDDRGFTRTYAYGGTGKATGWRAAHMPDWSGSPSDGAGSAAFDVTETSDANFLATTYDPHASSGTAHPSIQRVYDVEGHLIEERGAGTVLTTWEYDFDCDRPLNKVTVRENSRSTTELWNYDEECRVIAHELIENDHHYVPPRSTVVANDFYVYDPGSHLLREEHDIWGWKASYDYDWAGRLVRTERRDGTVTTVTYDIGDRVTKETTTAWDGRTRTTRWDYDGLGRLWHHWAPGASAATVYEYPDAVGGSGCCGSRTPGPTQVTNPDGQVTHYQYDDLGRLISTRDGDTGTVTRQRYEALGSLAAATELYGAPDVAPRRTTSYGYDWNGRLQSVEQPPALAGQPAGTTTYGYLIGGVEFRPDAAVTSVTDAEGRVSTYRWGTAGWNYRQVLSARLPDSGYDDYWYHDDSNLLWYRQRPTGHNTYYGYDGLGRVIQIQHGPHGWNVCCFVYEGDRVSIVREKSGDCTVASGVFGRTDFFRDADGRVEVEVREQDGGRVYRTDYGYDSLGDVEFVTYPSGMRVRYWRQHPDHDRITSVTADVPGDSSVFLADVVTHTEIGLLTGYALGNGLEYRIERGPRGRVARITAGRPGDVTPDLLDLQYSYLDPATGVEDPTGNIRGIVDAVDARSAEYLYDNLDRLIGATGWWGTLDWTYDKTGNRLSETRLDPAATVPHQSTYHHQSGTSRLTSVTDASSGTPEHELEYDASGNATRYDDLCLDYDNADRLIAIRRLTSPATCSRCAGSPTCPTVPVQENTYDYKFRRTRRVEHFDEDGTALSPPRCTAFYYDQVDRLIAEHDCTSGSDPDARDNVVAEYVYLEGYHVLAVRRGGAWYWYLNDHLPTPRKLVDASRTVVWDGRMEPFGETDEAVAAVQQPLRMPGQAADPASGLLYNGDRYVRPEIGRFLAVDAMSSAAVMHDPRSALGVIAGLRGKLLQRAVVSHTYTVARNNPLRIRDPSGRDWECGNPVLCDPDADDRETRIVQAAVDLYEFDLSCTWTFAKAYAECWARDPINWALAYATVECRQVCQAVATLAGWGKTACLACALAYAGPKLLLYIFSDSCFDEAARACG